MFSPRRTRNARDASRRAGQDQGVLVPATTLAIAWSGDAPMVGLPRRFTRLVGRERELDTLAHHHRRAGVALDNIGRYARKRGDLERLQPEVPLSSPANSGLPLEFAVVRPSPDDAIDMARLWLRNPLEAPPQPRRQSSTP